MIKFYAIQSNALFIYSTHRFIKCVLLKGGALLFVMTWLAIGFNRNETRQTDQNIYAWLNKEKYLCDVNKGAFQMNYTHT